MSTLQNTHLITTEAGAAVIIRAEINLRNGFRDNERSSLELVIVNYRTMIGILPTIGLTLLCDETYSYFQIIDICYKSNISHEFPVFIFTFKRL